MQGGLPFSEPTTSREAAERHAKNAPAQRKRVLAAYVAAGSDGLTDNEGCARHEMKGSSWRPRRLELMGVGLVVKTKGRRERCAVYVAAEYRRGA